MEKKQNVFYSWEVISNLGQFLSMKDLLHLATLSKEFNYLLKKYLRDSLLPLNSPPTNQFAQVKAIFNRKVYLHDRQTKQTKLIPTNLLVSTLHPQDHYSILQDLKQSYYLVQNLQELKINKKVPSAIIPFPKKYKLLTSTGSSAAFYTNGYKLFRFNFKNQNPLTDSFESEPCLHLKGSIEHIVCSQQYTLIFVKELPDQYSIKILKNSEDLKEIDVKLPIHLYTISIPDQVLLGYSSCYILLNEAIYEISLETGEVTPFQPLYQHKIVKLVGGKFHFFAFEKTKDLAIHWETKDVVEWAEKEGFQDELKVLKSQKVTGKKLLEMDKKYMQNVLGIINVKVQQKLKLKISECNRENPQDYILHGWGGNSEGQLGTNPSKDLPNPIKIKLPLQCELYSCSGNSTFIRNKKNSQVSYNHINSETNKIEWIELTTKKIWTIATFKEKIIFVVAATKDRVPQMLSEKVEVQKKEKLRTAKNIIDKIRWDENLSEEEFVVGYLDKYQGVLEIPFGELEQSEIKEYRIEYFKKGHEMVWNKKLRIDVI